MKFLLYLFISNHFLCRLVISAISSVVSERLFGSESSTDDDRPNGSIVTTTGMYDKLLLVNIIAKTGMCDKLLLFNTITTEGMYLC